MDPAPIPAPAALAGPPIRWGALAWARRHRRLVLLVGAILFGLSSWGLTPLTGSIVDWGMDGDLSPGVWNPLNWVVGVLLSGVILMALGWPLLIVGVLAALVLFWRPSGRRACPECDQPFDRSTGLCPICGPVQPRRPGVGLQHRVGRVRSGAGMIALLLMALWGTSCAIAWVQLELEEDAFGRRVEELRATGATYHEQRGRYGGLLMWKIWRGFWSHRD